MDNPTNTEQEDRPLLVPIVRGEIFPQQIHRAWEDLVEHATVIHTNRARPNYTKSMNYAGKLLVRELINLREAMKRDGH